MGELFKILLTAFTTIIGGVAVVVFGQILIRFYIEPLQRLKETIGEVTDALIYFADLIMSVKPTDTLEEIFNSRADRPDPYRREERLEASRVFRQKASLLLMRARVVPRYDLFAKWGILPTTDQLQVAHKNLVGLSNNMVKGYPAENDARRREISKALGLGLY